MLNSDKVIIYVSYFLKLVLIFAIVEAIYFQNWMSLFLACLTLFLTFLPAMISKNYKLNLPLELEFLILIFLFSSIFLGELKLYYDRYWWWDIVLHISSAIILGIIGFIIVYVLNEEKSVKMKLSPLFIAMFSFTFAVAIGAIWEIFEFAIDYFFGLNMQKNGLVDTMWDLIVNTFGALFVSVVGYFYSKKVKISFFQNLIEKSVNSFNSK